jgi:catechol 2,3-dioxygenase
MSEYMTPPETRIGHAHLRVADLDRAVPFYRDVLGFTVRWYEPASGLPLAILGAGSYHHHIALNTFVSAGGTPPPAGHTGLHHIAILYPSRRDLAYVTQRVLEHGHTIDSVDDHGGSQSVYLRDPDGNGLELTWDLPYERWFDAEGRPIIKAEPLDIAELLAELDSIVVE